MTPPPDDARSDGSERREAATGSETKRRQTARSETVRQTADGSDENETSLTDGRLQRVRRVRQTTTGQTDDRRVTETAGGTDQTRSKRVTRKTVHTDERRIIKMIDGLERRETAPDQTRTKTVRRTRRTKV